MKKKMNNRGLKAAIYAAQCSELKSHRVGAVIYHKKRLISIGCNQKKSHPQRITERSQHAEFNACLGFDKLDVRANKCSIYIARLTRTSKVGLAKPCKHCQTLLSSLGITKIFYTNKNGEISKL